jgi:polar amino acid transport system permease protein
MQTGFDFTVIGTNITYFFIGRYPHGPLGGIALTLYLAVVALILSFLGGLLLGLMSVSHNRVLKYSSLTIVNIIRGMPLLMVIFCFRHCWDIPSMKAGRSLWR